MAVADRSVAILHSHALCRDFGGVQALRGVEIAVQRGSITGLIGPNGSGKTTLFQVVSGVDRGATGEVWFDNQQILGLKPYEIYHRGLARTFQLSRVFPELTVLENLVVAAHRHDRGARERALGLLQRVKLEDYRNVPGTDLSYGQQKLVEFLRVLMSEPSLILLDEPAAGVNPTLRETLWDMVRHLNGLGTSFLIIEHNMEVIADLCSEVYVLSEGEVIARGDFATIRSNQQVMEAYFGKGRARATMTGDGRRA
jgi:ABC-type branched-subunit amino acid transport system ATPase component